MEDVLKCMLRSRPYGYWITSRGRRLYASEMLRAQGINPEAIRTHNDSGTRVVTDCQIGEMLGNCLGKSSERRKLLNPTTLLVQTYRKPNQSDLLPTIIFDLLLPRPPLYVRPYRPTFALTIASHTLHTTLSPTLPLTPTSHPPCSPPSRAIRLYTTRSTMTLRIATRPNPTLMKRLIATVHANRASDLPTTSCLLFIRHRRPTPTRLMKNDRRSQGKLR